MNVSEIKSSTSKCATVHGVVVGELSPVKTSSKNSAMKYFDGRFGDGTKTVRLVSFDSTLRSKLEDTMKAGGGVALQNCMIKRKAGSDEFELHVNNKRVVVNSPKKFKLSEDVRGNADACAEVKSLDELKDITEHQQVSISGKVTSLLKIEEVVKKSSGKMLKKRDFVIANSTASCRGVIWEENLDELKEEKSYKISNATVRSFNGVKYLSVGERAVITSVGDIGDIVDEAVFAGTGQIVVVEGEIIGVLKMEEYLGCRICNSKVIECGGIGKCSKCAAKVKISKCESKQIARVPVVDTNDKEYKMTMFDEIIHQVLGFSDAMLSGDIDDQLLATPCLSFTIKDEVVTSVCKVVHDQTE